MANSAKQIRHYHFVSQEVPQTTTSIIWIDVDPIFYELENNKNYLITFAAQVIPEYVLNTELRIMSGAMLIAEKQIDGNIFWIRDNDNAPPIIVNGKGDSLRLQMRTLFNGHIAGIDWATITIVEL